MCLDSRHGGLLRAGHTSESGIQEEGGPRGGTPRHLPVLSEWWGPPGLCLRRRCVLSLEQWLRVCHQKTGELSLAGWALQNPGKDAPGSRTRGKEPGYLCRWEAAHSAADPDPRSLLEAPVPSQSISKCHQQGHGHSSHSHTCPDLPKSQGPSIFHSRTTEACRQVSECILYYKNFKSGHIFLP